MPDDTLSFLLTTLDKKDGIEKKLDKPIRQSRDAYSIMTRVKLGS